MNKPALVLIPPSQSKSPGGSARRSVGAFDDALTVPRSEVRTALARYLAAASPEARSKVLDARGALLERALGASARLDDDGALLAAWQRYEGVVWTHLQPATLTRAQRRRLVVPSALYGLLTSADPIADYRLKMNVAVAPLPVLSRFWRPVITPLLAAYAPGTLIVDFLPHEHAASIDFDALSAEREVVRVRFVTHDGRRAAGHDAKAVKGVLARRVLVDGLDALSGLSWRGWRARLQGREVEVWAPKA